MCFSAGVSFGASALLIGTGIMAIRKRSTPQMLPFASVPLLFGIQQFSEGMLWLTFSNPELAHLNESSIYLFLLFAQVIWPVWIPFALWVMEPDGWKQKVLFAILIAGFAFSAYLVYCLFVFDVSATIKGGHIKYYLYFPNMELRRSAYILITLLPFFLSSLKMMKLLGAIFSAALVYSYFYFFGYVISVWCFFAALISAMILFVIIQNKPKRLFSAKQVPIKSIDQ